MATQKDEKTEQPTSRRTSEARKKGDVPRSKDLSASVSLLATILFFLIFMPYISNTTVAFWKKYFSRVGEIMITESSADIITRDIFSTYMKLVLPLMVLLVVAAFIMEIVQAGGINIVGENLRIKWEKVFFITEIPKGLKKVLVSVEALFELFKSVVKVVIIGFIAYLSIRGDIPAMLELPATSIANILSLMGRVFLKLAFNIILFLLVVSLLDYLWQKWRHTEKLKMSKQDIKDEHKQAEGDPQIKAQQKKIQFQWAMRRMMAEVPEADVVITNPTHYAVALKYDYGKMKSPKLIAKGKDLIAQRIKEVAREHNIPVVENPPVARAVFASVEIDHFIPGNLFKPIAEILAYIYKLKGKKVG